MGPELLIGSMYTPTAMAKTLAVWFTEGSLLLIKIIRIYNIVFPLVVSETQREKAKVNVLFYMNRKF